MGVCAMALGTTPFMQSTQAARYRRSLATSSALAMVGALLLQMSGGSFFIEGRPPHPSPPPSPPRPTPPSPAPPPPSSPSSDNCTHVEELTEGPYWIDENIKASDVRSNLSYGVPFNLTVKVVNGTLSELQGTCVPIEQARVDLWQCRYDGAYSDEEKESTAGETWLRGYQNTNSTGHASFYTIYPGWYRSRTVHIHLRVRIYEADGNTTSYDDTTQCYFDDAVSTAIFEEVYPYNSRGFQQRQIYNVNDSLFTSANVMNLTGSYKDAGGYSTVMELSLPFSSSGPSIGADGKSADMSDGAVLAV